MHSGLSLSTLWAELPYGTSTFSNAVARGRKEYELVKEFVSMVTLCCRDASAKQVVWRCYVY